MTSRKSYIYNKKPTFIPPLGNKKRPHFICYAMKKALEIDVARSEVNYVIQPRDPKNGSIIHRYRRLNEHRACAMRAMVLAMLYHFNIASNLVYASVEKLSDECGLSTLSSSGNKSITRASRLIKNFMEPMGFVKCEKIWDRILGNYMPKMITLTPLFFTLLEISETQLINAKKQQLGWINKNLIRKGLKSITMLEAQRRFKDTHFQNILKYRMSKHTFYKKKKNAQRLIALDEKEARQTILRALVAKYSISELANMGVHGLKKQVNISYYHLKKIANNTYSDN